MFGTNLNCALSGPSRVTSIRHILPQKRPEDGDQSDAFGFQPITAIFTHQSNDVWTLYFDNGDSLGVTYNHPIYSVTADDWRLAGELEIGEEVLTKEGTVAVTKKVPQPGVFPVWNLEVRGWHNFLVGKQRIVVHNGCWSPRLQKYGKRSASVYQKAIDHIWAGHSYLSRAPNKGYFKKSLDDRIKLKKYLTGAYNKGTLLSDETRERSVDGIVRTYKTVVRDLGKNVGKLRDHSTNTNIITLIYDITDRNPIFNNAFPGRPQQ